MMATPTEILFLVGRILLGGFFVWSGVNHLRNHRMFAQYASSKGMPAPTLSVIGTGGLLLVGGASVVTGFLPLVGLALLAVFLVGVTPVMHAFWKVEDPMARVGEVVNFTKNVALLGAVAALAVVPQPWPLGLAGF